MDKIIQFPEGIKGNFVLSKGLGRVLLVFFEDGWNGFSAAVLKKIPLTSKNGRIFLNFFRGSAIELKVEDSGKTNIPYVYWDYLTEGKENMMAEVYTVNEYLDMRKESIGETEKRVLKYVSFVVVAQEI